MSRPNRKLQFFDELVVADSAQVPGSCAQDFGAFGTATKHALPQSANLILRPGRGGGHAPLEALVFRGACIKFAPAPPESIPTDCYFHDKLAGFRKTLLLMKCYGGRFWESLLFLVKSGYLAAFVLLALSDF